MLYVRAYACMCARRSGTHSGFSLMESKQEMVPCTRPIESAQLLSSLIFSNLVYKELNSQPNGQPFILVLEFKPRGEHFGVALEGCIYSSFQRMPSDGLKAKSPSGDARPSKGCVVNHGSSYMSAVLQWVQL